MTNAMQLLRKIKTYITTHRKHLLIGGLGVSLVVAYAITYVPSRHIEYAYSGSSCVNEVIPLPGIYKVNDDSTYDTEFSGGFSIGGVQLLATEMCFTPRESPEEGRHVASVSVLGTWLASTQFVLEVPEAPVADTSTLAEPIPTTKPLEMAMSRDDEVFDYTLDIGDQTADCTAESRSLVCDIVPLELKQGATYDTVLSRSFEGEDAIDLHEGTLETLRPIKVTKTSVKAGQVVYAKPKQYVIETDKELEAAEVILERVQDSKRTEVTASVGADGKRLTVSPEDELARSSSYELTVTSLDAKDGSTLAEPYVLKFRMSGGPTLQNASVGDVEAPQSGSITLTFDQLLLESQDVTKLVTVNGAQVSTSVSGSSLTVSYSGVGKCKSIKIAIKAGLLSKYNVKQDQATNFSTRTVCHTVETIGYSHEGRPIVGYFFGDAGGKTVLFTGAIHGNEKSSYDTMIGWVNELERSATTIPAGVQVVVIPMLNPDGYYTYGRDNARGVNLNRNFPTANWEKDISVTGGTDKGGGGASAGSERETQALMNIAQRLNPWLTVTYHSQGAIVNSNAMSRAETLGSRYAGSVGYSFVPDSATTGTFGFTMTGTYEDWMSESGRAAFLIELPSHYGDYSAQHSSALWAIVRS